ncbi:hypothetical protein B0T26DRAFT_676742 [Lasiosphaeria miniovina]|uniref:Uncharacterized protein n=1 Tax=Lasiosphaeria miniovina TaxID=1954250 RepID=A0AA40DWW5_9PEZI|nr:uncharacterized protein B0T26DRAFT_676742 [Lasiosphaeria miniovina]KAK0718595.1 hypothetical protein B0T26DRAFT_676742 [Lasiosphaeria miniovina]
MDNGPGALPDSLSTSASIIKPQLLETHLALLSYLLDEFSNHARSAREAGADLKPVFTRLGEGETEERWALLRDEVPVKTTLDSCLSHEGFPEYIDDQLSDTKTIHKSSPKLSRNPSTSSAQSAKTVVSIRSKTRVRSICSAGNYSHGSGRISPSLSLDRSTRRKKEGKAFEIKIPAMGLKQSNLERYLEMEAPGYFIELEKLVIAYTQATAGRKRLQSTHVLGDRTPGQGCTS